MKIAVTSDTHFGDPKCSLVVAKKSNGYEIGQKYEEFRNGVGEGNKYLVLLGDIFDYSIVSYAEAYTAAGVFFKQLVNDNLTDVIIYVPGNHDFQFWHWVENQVNVFEQIKKGRPPRGCRWSVPAIIDCRSRGRGKELFLPGVTRRKGRHPYGNLFLDQLTNGQHPFVVAYPNVYVITDSTSVLFTHGHYMELYWAAIGEYGPKILGADLSIGDFLDLKELVAVNVPTNQLASSGIGQAGPFTDWIRMIQRYIKDQSCQSGGPRLLKIKKYLDKLDEELLDPLIKYHKLDPREWISDIGLHKVKEMVLEMIGDIEETQFSQEFLNDPGVKGRFQTYYLACIAEVDGLNDLGDYSGNKAIPYPKHVVMGHTHQPISWNCLDYKRRLEGNTVYLHNTGGWLYKEDAEGNDEFMGAEIFHIEEGRISSTTIQ